MRINIKTSAEITIMQEGGKILSDVMEKTLKKATPGVKTIELEKFADKEIKRAGAQASFRTVKNYPFATCMCVNNIVVHGLPGEYVLRENDILGVDMGVLYKGFHTDMSWTVLVSQNGNSDSSPVIPGVSQRYLSEAKISVATTRDPETLDSRLRGNDKREDVDKKVRFLEIGKEALKNAISAARAGNYVWDISRAIQDVVEKKGGYHAVRALTGHGIGKVLHEDPFIPCFAEGKREKSAKLQAGMTLAIEVIYAEGTGKIWFENSDGWTITTRDGSLSGLFECTVAISDKEPEILTSCPTTDFLI